MTQDDELDPRLNAYRDDLACRSLEGKVAAARFVEGETRQVVAESLPVRAAPRHDARLDTEVLYGETLTVYDDAEGWAWCQADRDGYVGYVPAVELSPTPFEATHRVSSVVAIVYAEASALVAPMMRLSFGARVRVEALEGDFACLSGGGAIGRRHLTELDARQPDYVATAVQFMGLPYLLGGKTAYGLDCSGLVQLVLQAAGHNPPRDSDMQERAIAPKIDIGADLAGFQRGDVVFWPGHVGIMVDPTMIVHATATRMSVTLEPVCDVAERAREGGPVISSASRPGL